jgi:hypothetical protein
MKSERKLHKGTMDDMGDEQRKMVERMKLELRNEFLLAPEVGTTWHISRFLRARDFNFEKAKQMMQEYLNLRKRKDFKRIAAISQTDERAQLLRKFYTSGHYGNDYEGRVVLIERVTSYKPEELFKHFTNEEIEDHLIQIHERLMFIEMPLSSEVFKKRIDNTMLIIDLKNVNVISMFKSKLKYFIKTATKIGQDYYPEILSKSFFVNSPMIFKAIWAIISLWMDKKTISKFEFESGDGLKRLAQLLDVSQLPIEMGGKNPAPIPQGFGHWTDDLLQSYEEKTFMPQDRRPEFEYYYTPEERKQLSQKKTPVSFEDITKSSFIQTSQFHSQPVIRDLKVSNFRVSLYRSRND